MISGDNYAAIRCAQPRRLALGMSVAAAVALLCAGPVMAQAPAWAVATWKGTLDNYRVDPNGPDRVLVIQANGACGWSYTAAAAASGDGAQSCAVAGDTINILTTGSSTVQLRHKNGKLEGTFQTKRGGSYLITMTRQ